MKYFYVIIKVFTWVLLMLAFIRFFTFSQDNSLSLQPDWFSGDMNSFEDGSQTLVAYSNPGFPIQIDGHSTEGRYELAWAINYVTAGLVGVIIAVILYKLPPKKQ